MAQLLTGKEVVQSIHADVKDRIEKLEESGIEPTLALVRVGMRLDDISYERQAVKKAELLNIRTLSFSLDEMTTQTEINETVRIINENDRINGCLMLRPLPDHIDEQAVCKALNYQKDVDGISVDSLAAVFTDEGYGFPPCTAAAVIELLDHYDISLEGKNVVIIGRSLVVGKPLAMMMMKRNATVTICHSKTKNLPALSREADIVVCAIGKAKMCGPDYFSAGQVVIDVGINIDENGKFSGDVDFDAVEPLVDAITPVPGGIGSVTTSVLMQNTVEAATRMQVS
ncbi:MAG: bifunctional 5,10-methylenetetrahydrofolate dehydrogenase/5,10-methenyltetrahydrofolate cyclohydrolase [Raoultibacter sp.]|jgi:methylenetetrahydrofolate dehydrogenase (NADP+)/methenyltetrahydrofolate cyclohydrolase